MVDTLVSVNVGMPADVDWRGRKVHTGIWKRSVAGPQTVRRLNIDGDGQGDLAGHGGEQRAVLVYQLDSYRHWQAHFGRDDFTYGQFGENLTVDGLPDDEVCIGDRYRIGSAEFEVTQPRVTCFRVGVRLGHPEMPSLLVEQHRPGFYMRVLTEGRIRAGDSIEKSADGPGSVTVREADALLYLPHPDPERLRVAARIPALSPGWQGSFRELLDVHPSSSTALGWSGFRTLRVVRIVPETPTVASVELAGDEPVLPPARPGQYLSLRLPEAGDPAPVRSYSLSSAPGAATYRISVKQEPHGVASSYLNTRLRPGTSLEVAAPRGEFVLTEESTPLLLVSAGIGVTPMLAMLYALVAAEADRTVWWLHAARNAAEHALAAEADDLLHRLSDARVRIFYSSPGPADLERPDASSGHLSGDALRHLDLPPEATAYVCGPTGFMADVDTALVGLGIAADRIRTELFTTRESLNPGVVPQPRVPPHQPPGTAGSGPLVTFARSGTATRFDPRWGSLLELAEASDVPTRWSCRSGVCQTCHTPLLSGEVRYTNEPLQPPPDDEVLICSSEPVTDVVLDV